MKRVTAVLLVLLTALAVFAACSKNSVHTVTFDSSGGTQIKTQHIRDGESAKKPWDPHKEGFTFIEWQYNGTAFDFNTAITGDITLVASYSIDEGTDIVLLVLCYGDSRENEIIEIKRGEAAFAPPTPEREGYKFEGWFNGDTEFDFSTPINDDLNLTAKWKATGKTESGSENQPAAAEESAQKYSDTAAKYSGRWYLDGYSDIFVDVSNSASGMNLRSYNFSLPSSSGSVAAYTLYPSKSLSSSGGSWGNSISVPFASWESSLRANKIILGSSCFYINNKKFVKAPGTKDRYTGTCYREVRGVWYLFNNPDSTIEIYTAQKGGDETGDRFGIKATNFDIATLSTYTKSSTGGGYADRKSDWDSYGISVSNGVLTIKNKNGTRTFYSKKKYKSVTGVRLSATETKLRVGQTKVLTATVIPADAYDKDYTWSSDDPSIAEVAGGIVVAKKEGTTNIRVTTKDGNRVAVCKVTVYIDHVTGVTLNSSSLSLTVGDSRQLRATVAPRNAANQKVTWSSSNSNIASVSSSGRVTAKAKGTAVITVKTEDGNKTASCTVTVKNPTLAAVAAAQVSNNGTAAPQIHASALVSGGTGKYTSYKIKIFLNGALVAEKSEKSMSYTPKVSGMYTVEVTVTDSDGETASGKMLINVSVVEPTEKPTEKPSERQTEKPTEKPTENPTEKPTENPTEKPTEKPSDEPINPIPSEPVDPVTEPATEAPLAPEPALD